MKIADEISHEISYRSHMSEILIMNSYENYEISSEIVVGFNYDFI